MGGHRFSVGLSFMARVRIMSKDTSSGRSGDFLGAMHMGLGYFQNYVGALIFRASDKASSCFNKTSTYVYTISKV
jgi:hypothetical protein